MNINREINQNKGPHNLDPKSRIDYLIEISTWLESSNTNYFEIPKRFIGFGQPIHSINILVSINSFG